VKVHYVTEWLRGIVSVGLLVASIGVASANLTPTLDSVTPSGSDFKWTYTAGVDAVQKVLTGDYFTIYDFAGFTGVSGAPAGWTLLTALVGTTPASVLPEDDGGIPNLTWVRTGGTITGPADLGLFWANSGYSETVTDSFTGIAHRISDGSPIANVGTVEVPSGTPEPCSMALLGVGALPLLRGLRRRRAAKNAQG
jgi:MYXO-CTERM domain-containing protein